jgi:hypothetical protein
MSFNSFRLLRFKFLEDNIGSDHAVILGTKKVLLSAPHGVTQTRLGKNKVAEIGTIPFSLILQKRCKTHLIVKTKNNFDDANYDENCEYRQEIKSLILDHNITHLIDFHGLASKRPMDINLGINLGHNIETNVSLFENLVKILKNEGFKVTIDNPFSGGKTTVSGWTKANFDNLWTLQVEINSKLTNRSENYDKLNRLLNVFERFINQI